MPYGMEGPGGATLPANVYEPTVQSLREHEVPAWYHDAKLGIFIHWSLSSVPGFAPRDHDITELLRDHYDDLCPLTPYTEWYENSLRFPESPVARYHREHYGERPYAAFQADFEAGLAHWDPAAWAADFEAAGARYVVLVTKHHDGYCLWPSRVRNPHRPGYASQRDCVGELAAAVRARGMRFGIYYSGGIDWTFNDAPCRNPGEFMASMPRGDYPAYAEAQLRELVEQVEPDVIWNDISWPTDPARLYRLFADYYNAHPDGVLNDRWTPDSLFFSALRIRPLRALLNTVAKRHFAKEGATLAGRPPPVYDTRTPEYAVFPGIRSEKWECVRGMDKSFGYNRTSLPEDFLGHAELIHSLADIASKNGNLLLNVGPRGEDAAIPEEQRERLRWLGAWLGTNGEAVYGTRPWKRAEGETTDGLALRFTARDDTLYAIALGRPRTDTITLRDLPASDAAQVSALGGEAVTWSARAGELTVQCRSWPEGPAPVLRIAGAAVA